MKDNAISKVSVILLNWNTAEHTVNCVESLLQSDYQNCIINIIDNGSEIDDYNKIITLESNVVLVHKLDQNLGYVGGVNYGISIAQKQSADYILIMNNDTIIDSRAITELVAASKRHNDKCITTGIVFDFFDPSLIQQTGSGYLDKNKLLFKQLHLYEKDIVNSDKDIKMDMIDDVFWLLPIEVQQRVGCYSSDFWFNSEQADYALRAVKQGYELIFTSKAKLWHKGSVSIGGRRANPVREYFDTKSRLIFRFKHLNKIQFCQYYLLIIHEIFIGFIKQGIKQLIGMEAFLSVCYAKLLGLIGFHKWVFIRTADRGQVPKTLLRMSRQ